MQVPVNRDESSSIVNSHNEWDPLEEVIVGIPEGACYLPWHISLEASTHENYVREVGEVHRVLGGMLRPQEQVEAVQKQLDEFVHILKQEGVVVRRPEIINQARPYSSMDWSCPGGNAQANPRDSLLVVGNQIIEAPMAYRSRFFEVHGYRKILQDYFEKGAGWAAPFSK